MDSQPLAKPPDHANSDASALRDTVGQHYAALRRWLGAVAGIDGGLPVAQLRAHQTWLLNALLTPGKSWYRPLPVAVEASARWRPDGVESARFILGASLEALPGNPLNLLETFGLDLRLPAAVRARVAAMLAANQVPSAVQIGLAATPNGWSRRLYLERGSLPMHMHAIEWRKGELRERTYAVHEPLAMDALGDVPPTVRRAWEALIADGARHPGLLRQDVDGRSVALHVQMRRTDVAARIPGLLRLGDALRVPRAPVERWLEKMPENNQLTVVSLGRDGPLQMNVYVAPRQDDLPQPGPQPGDIRRTPGTICWNLGLRGQDETRGWLLFALPETQVPLRPAAATSAVQIWTGSSVPDATPLATHLARLVPQVPGTLADRLAAAHAPLLQALEDAGLEVRGRHAPRAA